jgi:hypothetical protein
MMLEVCDLDRLAELGRYPAPFNANSLDPNAETVSRTTMPPPLMTRAAWRKILEIDRDVYSAGTCTQVAQLSRPATGWHLRIRLAMSSPTRLHVLHAIASATRFQLFRSALPFASRSRRRASAEAPTPR